MKRMRAFTLGRTTSYELSFAEERMKGRTLYKAPGGWCFATRNHAEQVRARLHELVPGWRPEDFTVYGLDVESWDRQVTCWPDPTDGVHRLLTDVPLVRLIF